MYIDEEQEKGKRAESSRAWLECGNDAHAQSNGELRFDLDKVRRRKSRNRAFIECRDLRGLFAFGRLGPRNFCFVSVNSERRRAEVRGSDEILV